MWTGITRLNMESSIKATWQEGKKQENTSAKSVLHNKDCTLMQHVNTEAVPLKDDDTSSVRSLPWCLCLYINVVRLKENTALSLTMYSVPDTEWFGAFNIKQDDMNKDQQTEQPPLTVSSQDGSKVPSGKVINVYYHITMRSGGLSSTSDHSTSVSPHGLIP